MSGRRNFLKLAGLITAAGLGLPQAGCVPELEPEGLSLVPPLTVTVGDTQKPVYQLSPKDQQMLSQWLQTLPQQLPKMSPSQIDLSVPPFNRSPENLPQLPVGNALTQLNVLSNGDLLLAIDNQLTQTLYLLNPNYYLFVPEKETASSFSISSVNRLDASNRKVVQTIRRPLNYYQNSNYADFFKIETTSYEINSQNQSAPLYPPGCRRFVEDYLTNPLAILPNEYSLAPCHDPATALAVFQALLLLAHRRTILTSGTNPQPLNLYHTEQPDHAILTLRPEVFSEVGSYVRDGLSSELYSLESAFNATLSKLPQELPVAYRILEGKINDKGQYEERTRIIFVYNDRVTSNWFKSNEQAEPLVDAQAINPNELPADMAFALNLNTEGFKPVSIQQAPGCIYWTGEKYAPGVATSKEIILEMGQFGPKLLKEIIGAQTGSTNASDLRKEVSDLTSWYYDLKSHGVEWAGPAGLTIPEWLSKLLWGMRPQDPSLTDALEQANYILPLFSDSVLAELEEAGSQLVVYRGNEGINTDVYTAKKYPLTGQNITIEGYQGQISRGDFLPISKKKQSKLIKPGSIGQRYSSAQVLILGQSFNNYLLLPYTAGEFTVIRGDSLNKVRALIKQIVAIGNTVPDYPPEYRGQVPIYDLVQKQAATAQIAQQLNQMPIF